MLNYEEKNIEEIIRRLSHRQLEVLLTFIPSGERTGDYTTVGRASKSVHTAENVDTDKTIGGIFSSISRIATMNGPLILPVGRSEDEGMRWILNTKVISRDELKDILLQIPGLNI